MYNRELCELVKRFRVAADIALENGDFKDDVTFCNFPYDCCGDTCYLLAHYLQIKGYDTIYVCGTRNYQTHAWLVLKDEKIKGLESFEWEIPSHVEDAWNGYSGGNYTVPNNKNYSWEDIADGIIIDITADQFDEMKGHPYYVNLTNEFYRSFEYEPAADIELFLEGRLLRIYNLIVKYV